jgi:hypothetical protein
MPPDSGPPAGAHRARCDAAMCALDPNQQTMSVQSAAAREMGTKHRMGK